MIADAQSPERVGYDETIARAVPHRRGSYVTIEAAAVELSTTPEALRTRCRRAAVKRGNDVVALLGAGIVAHKFGRHWRVRFPAE